jgi:hypothetical protein
MHTRGDMRQKGLFINKGGRILNNGNYEIINDSNNGKLDGIEVKPRVCGGSEAIGMTSMIMGSVVDEYGELL